FAAIERPSSSNRVAQAIAKRADAGEGLRANQGFINGLSYDPNEIAPDPDASRADSLLAADRIRVGMAGNLKSFLLVDRAGENTRGDGVDYNGSPTGYTEDPQEVITYVSKHDNQTLFDINAYKTPTGTSMDDRVRIQNLGVSITALGQGIPFFHAGVELLRSKSMQRDSFDSGDWFNALDFSYQSTRWNVGLPRADKDMDNWPTIQTVIADSSIDPQPVHIAAAREHFLEMLEVRASTPLLRLRTADDVNTRVHYHNTGPDQVPGLIVQTVSDSTCAGEDLDPTVEGLVGIINASDEAQSFVLSGANGYVLHPTLAASADSVVQGASFDDGSDTFTVPARTTAVFWIPQSGAQGSGTPCNPL
ncbi:MAG: alpha-1,6-glucosidase domain-containing protein, partial [Myxococcota bacterium]